MREKDRKGNILMENIVFIIINVMFLTILAIFLTSQMNNATVTEERYAKQIALLIDAAKPGMEMTLKIPKKTLREAEENGLSEDEIITIDGNQINVKIRKGGGYDYSFFNEINVTPSMLASKGELVLFMRRQNEQERR